MTLCRRHQDARRDALNPFLEKAKLGNGNAKAISDLRLAQALKQALLAESLPDVQINFRRWSLHPPASPDVYFYVDISNQGTSRKCLVSLAESSRIR